MIWIILSFIALACLIILIRILYKGRKEAESNKRIYENYKMPKK